jgi:poly-beta-1,6-N-acetyl-D-glucosamine synthase
MLVSLFYIAFGLVTSIQICIWWFVHRKVATHIDTAVHEPNQWPGVSVVVCGRNAATCLEVGLPAILAQKYLGQWELVVVDDDSSDHTQHVLKELHHPLLVPIYLKNKTKAGKKQALELGIRSAQYPIILVTDADCEPNSKDWITHMVRPFIEGKELVLGFAPFRRERGCLYAWQRYEACYTALLYFGWALQGKPYMGVGRNMAYRKSLFTAINGFDTHADLPSGDDDLFVNAIARGDTVAAVMHPDSFMYSSAKDTWGAYYRQKTRHFSTSTRYQSKHQWILTVAGLSHSLHYFFILVAFLAQWGMVFVLLLTLIRIIIIIQICKPVLRRFHEQGLLPWLPVFDPLVAVYYSVFIPGIIINHFYTPRSWT